MSQITVAIIMRTTKEIIKQQSLITFFRNNIKHRRIIKHNHNKH